MKKWAKSGNEIPISRLIHSTLIYVEKNCFVIPTNSQISYISKAKIMQNFFIAKNYMMKLYAIIVWQRKNSQYPLSNSPHKSDLNQILANERIVSDFIRTMIKNENSNLKPIIKNSIDNYTLIPYSGPKDKVTNKNILKNIQTEIKSKNENQIGKTKIKMIVHHTNYFDFYLDLSLFLATHTNLVLLHKTNRVITMKGNLRKIDSYLLVDKKIGMIDIEVGIHHLPFIRKIKIKWPQSIPYPQKDIAQQISALISHTNRSNSRFVSSAYNLIHHFYLVGQYVFFISKLNDYSADFHYTVAVTSSRTATISFARFPSRISSLRLELLESRIAVTSNAQLAELPPRNPQTGEFCVSEAFEMSAPRQAKSRLSFASLSFTDACAVDVRRELSVLSARMFFTSLLCAWEAVQQSVTRAGLVHACATLSCSHAAITMCEISVRLFNICQVSFCLDAGSDSLVLARTTGLVMLHALRARPFDVSLRAEPESVSKFLVESWNAAKIATSFGLLFGGHSLSLIPTVSVRNDLCVGLSYAPDFLFAAHFGAGSFQFVIISRRSGKVERSKSHASVNYFRLRTMPNAELSGTLMANRNLIVFLQLEEELRALGFLTARKENELKIAMMPILTVMLKMKNSGYWSLTFDKSTYPFFSKNLISVTCPCATCRLAGLVVQILSDVQRFSSVVFQSTSVSRFQMDIDGVSLLHELCVRIRAGGSSFIADFGPFRDIYTESNGITKYVLFPAVRPVIKFHLTSQLSHISTFEDIRTGQAPLESFGAFLGQKLAALTRFISSFSKSWSLSPISDSRPFFAVYRGCLTLNASLQPDATFTLTAPLAGQSSFLVLPLASALPVSFTVVDDKQGRADGQSASNAQRASQRASYAACRVKASELSSVCGKIEAFLPFFDAMDRCGTRLFFFNRSVLFAAKVRAGESAFDVKVKLAQNSFVVDSVSVPLIKDITAHFSSISGVSFAARRAFFSTVFDVIRAEREVANRIAAVLNAIIQVRVRQSPFASFGQAASLLSMEALALDTKVSESHPRVRIAVSEDGLSCVLSSDDCTKFSIASQAGGRTLTYDALLCIANLSAQNGTKLVPSLLS